MNMAEPLNWSREGRDWPHRESSRFVEAAGVRWHVQTIGTGAADVVLVHGTGAATHSWRGLIPLLAPHARVVAIDLPGHGFSSAPRDGRYGLPDMAIALEGLLRKCRFSPRLVVGHSAGAAVLARMCLDGAITPVHLVSVNGALLPFQGIAGEIFSPLARVLSGTRIVPKLFAWRASDPTVLRRLLDATGSRVDESGQQLYGTVIANPHHAAAALAMMAQWNLRPLAEDLPKLAALNSKLTLIVGSADRTVAPSEAARAAALVAGARVVTLEGLGHLAHEERPDAVAKILTPLIKATL
jgi:magnesium chelatase accessory protein